MFVLTGRPPDFTIHRQPFRAESGVIHGFEIEAIRDTQTCASLVNRYSLLSPWEVERMAGLTLWKCTCGLKFKVVTETDGTIQRHSCTCGLEVEFHGTITKVFVAKERVPMTEDWQQVPTEKSFAAHR